MKKQPSLSDIKTFVALAEAGSFTRAAEKLRYSRSHISKQLAQLEEDLGVTLMVRTTRTQHLTPQGEAFYARCKTSLNGIALAIDRAIEGADALSGTIKINSVGGYIGEDILAPLLCDFMAQHPDISIELDFASKRVDLIAGEFDFVFRMGELIDSSLIARKLTDIHSNTFASPGYIARYGKPQNPKELEGHRCITGSLRQWSFTNNKNDKRLEISVDGNLTCKNGRTMVSAAVAGQGIIRVPEFYCKREWQQELLQPLFDDWVIDSTPLYLVYLRDKHQPARLTAFKQYVVDNFDHYMP